MSNGPVLITGATGFIGSHLVRSMVEDGRPVHVILRPESKTGLLWQVLNQIQLHIHDGSTSSLIKIFEEVHPYCVFHLASLFVAEHQSADVEPLIASNVLFGTQLLEAMSIAKVDNFINTGTSWQHYHSTSERSVCLYAATKTAFEKILDYYVDSTALRAITLKLFDTYGPHDPRKKLFWHLREAARLNTSLQMSTGEQLLDLVYIDDVVNAFKVAELRFSENLFKNHESYAVSSGTQVSLREVVRIYESILDKKIPVDWGCRPYRKREVMRTWTRFQTIPAWQAHVDLLSGLRLMEAFTSSLRDQK